MLRDAYEGRLQPLYDYTSDLPNIEGAAVPFLARDKITRNMSNYTSFDAGRGCPFQCSFCTIINVQGRKSRYRSADDVEKIVRENYAQGIKNFFITDDNFARNRNWEQIFDRLIELREGEGIPIKLIIQVDTLCHRIPHFIEKAGRAGAKRVFIGLENISPDNLIGAKKKQNRITEYRTMLQAWKAVRAITYCGYIIGFPNDTPERVIRDIEIIKRELPVDFLEFFCLTPLPGSEDHQTLHRNGVWMDPDLNKYDAVHVTTGHPLMSAEEWRDTYRRAWDAFYDPAHVETLMRRARACRIPPRKIAGTALGFYGSMAIEGVHPLEGGWLRRKYRKDRRPGLPIESPFVFYPRYAWESAAKAARFAALWLRYRWIRRRVEADPAGRAYRDLALTPVTESRGRRAGDLSRDRVGQAGGRQGQAATSAAKDAAPGPGCRGCGLVKGRVGGASVVRRATVFQRHEGSGCSAARKTFEALYGSFRPQDHRDPPRLSVADRAPGALPRGLGADHVGHRLEDPVDVRALGDQGRRELEGVRGDPGHDAALVALDHRLEAALARLAGPRLHLDRAHQAEIADVAHARQVAAGVQRVLEVGLEREHPLEDALLLVGLEGWRRRRRPPPDGRCRCSRGTAR